LEIRTILVPFPADLAPIFKFIQGLVANSLFSQKQGMFLVVTGNSVSETGKLQDPAADKPAALVLLSRP
jgi:hypothetical protein